MTGFLSALAALIILIYLAYIARTRYRRRQALRCRMRTVLSGLREQVRREQ